MKYFKEMWMVFPWRIEENIKAVTIFSGNILVNILFACDTGV
jgi:hypothetical protein